MLKANAHPVAAGSVVDLLTGGGGGFGVPSERDPARVRRRDRRLRQREAAERDYGVVLDERLQVDETLTHQLRARSTE